MFLSSLKKEEKEKIPVSQMTYFKKIKSCSVTWC